MESGFRSGSMELSARRVEVGEHAVDLELQVRNAGEAPLRLAALRLRVLWTPAEAGALVTLCQPAGHALPSAPLSAGWRSSELVAVAGVARDGPACLVGVVEGDAAFGRVHVHGSGGFARFEADLQLGGVLRAGEVLRPGSVRVALGVGAQLLLEDYAHAFGQRAAARVARPFMASALLGGRRIEVEGELLRDLEALSASGGEAGFDAVVVAAEGMSQSGDWLSEAGREARGLAAQAEEMRGAGFIPGLRVSPFCVGSRNRILDQHPEWLLEGEVGPLRVAGTQGMSAGEAPYVLDASHPELLAHFERAGAELAALGFGFLQLDSLDLALLRGRFSREDPSAATRLRGALDALRRGLGDEVFLLGGCAPLGVGTGRLDAFRVASRARASRAVPGAAAGVARASAAAAEMLDRAWMHRRLFINDLGGLSTRWGGNALEAGESSALATAWSTAGSLQLVEDWGSLDASARGFIGAVLERARALDVAGIPGTVRVQSPLSPGPRRYFEAVATDGIHLGDVNAGDVALESSEALRDLRVLLQVGEGQDAAKRPDRLAPHSGSLRFAERMAPLAVFCDFDGTFSVQDVGSTLAKRHAGVRRERAWARYERGEITPWEYNMEILHGLEIPVAELDRFLNEEIDLDPGARRLLAWCDTHEVSFRILSDGFDWNLMRLQAIHGVRLSCESNHLHYDRGRWSIRAGGPDASCGCGTGLCKAAALRRYRSLNPERKLVHIGNGRVSDSCGALEADQAFAKDSLADSLRACGEPFLPFETLDDVIPALEALLSDR